MEKVILKWVGGVVFFNEDHTTFAEMSPKTMMLTALAKCAGITAIMMLNKRRIEVRSMVVEIEGVLEGVGAESYFKAFRQTFHVECDPFMQEQAVTAIETAVDRHCPLTSMYRKIAPVEHILHVNVMAGAIF